MKEQRYTLIKGLGIIDNKTDDLYITPTEITGLLNRLNQEIEALKK